MKCENCPYYYAIGFAYKECQFVGDFGAPCQEPDPEPPQFTVKYFGYVYHGDKEHDWNEFSTDDFNKAIEFYNVYKPEGLDVYIEDNWYDVTYADGEWC